jgi:hypothetical protein
MEALIAILNARPAFNMTLDLCQIQYGTTGTGQILFSISGRQEVSVKSKKRHFGKIGMSGI